MAVVISIALAAQIGLELLFALRLMSDQNRNSQEVKRILSLKEE